MFILVASLLLIFYLFQKLTIGKTKSSTCLLGKTAIITGGNSGIGFQVALNLASRGCRVIIADVEDAENSKNRIIEETGNTNIVAKKLDLASFKSVREFAQNIKNTEKSLNILINNAGVGAMSDHYTSDGLNPVMQINSFGHFLLTHLLYDLLKKSAPSRVVFTSSWMAFTHHLTLNNLNYPKSHSRGVIAETIIYSNSNLCNIMIADEFARKFDGSKIAVNSVHPGAVRTDIFNKSYKTRPVMGWVWNLMVFLFGKDSWEGAQTTIHVAIAKQLENVSGRYFWDCMEFPKPSLAKNVKFRELLWEKVEELVRLKENEKL